MDIGVITRLTEGKNTFEEVKKFGLTVCQFVNWNPALWRDDIAAQVIADMKSSGIRVSGLWAGYTGACKWNFTEGPTTLGLLPKELRAQRVQELKLAADFAKKIGVKAVITHAGFLPENMTDPEYQPILDAVKDIGAYCKKQGVEFWFETGQETPVTLLRFIEESGLDNLGINLDPANLILYGKGNPIDALDVFGKYVKNIHAKDGLYPTDGRNLGKETPIGAGKVRFPEFIKRLKEIGFTGELIIEREISGSQKDDDIKKSIGDLTRWVNA